MQRVLAGLTAAEHELRAAHRPDWIADACAAARQIITSPDPTRRTAIRI